MPLSTQTQTEVIKQALADRDAGEFTEYKGDKIVDAVFAPLDFISGTRSTSEIAEDKQALYNSVRANNG